MTDDRAALFKRIEAMPAALIGGVNVVPKDGVLALLAERGSAAPDSGLSWSGHNISGDAESIRVVKAALHDAGTVAELKDEIRRLRGAVVEPPEPHDVFRRYWENIDTKRTSYGNSRDDFIAGWNSALAAAPVVPSSEPKEL